MPKSDQGSLSGRYRLIPRTLIFLTRDERVLLIKGAPDKRLWANQYNGIGGHIEQGEDIYNAAQRELLEETGLWVPMLQLCSVITIDTGEKTGIGVFVFRGEYTNGELKPSREGELLWVACDQINTLPLVEDLKVLLPLVLNWQLGEPVMPARYFYDKNGALKIEFATYIK